MKKLSLFSIILASSLLLSACGRQPADNQNKPTDNQAENKFSLRELISKGVAQKCTYSSSNEDGNFTGEVVISGNKFRQTITIASNGEEKTMHYISDGQYIYTWEGNGNAFAAKFPADFGETDSDSEDDVQEFDYSHADLDSEYQGECLPTTVSDADFQAPKDINFQDYGQMMNQWQNMNTSDFMNPEQ